MAVGLVMFFGGLVIGLGIGFFVGLFVPEIQTYIAERRVQRSVPDSPQEWFAE